MHVTQFKLATDIALSHTLIKLMHTEYRKQFNTFPTFVALGSELYGSVRQIQMLESVLGFMELKVIADYTIGPWDIAVCDGIYGRALVYTSPEY